MHVHILHVTEIVPGEMARMHHFKGYMYIYVLNQLYTPGPLTSTYITHLGLPRHHSFGFEWLYCPHGYIVDIITWWWNYRWWHRWKKKEWKNWQTSIWNIKPEPSDYIGVQCTKHWATTPDKFVSQFLLMNTKPLLWTTFCLSILHISTMSNEKWGNKPLPGVMAWCLATGLLVNGPLFSALDGTFHLCHPHRETWKLISNWNLPKQLKQD